MNKILLILLVGVVMISGCVTLESSYKVDECFDNIGKEFCANNSMDYAYSIINRIVGTYFRCYENVGERLREEGTEELYYTNKEIERCKSLYVDIEYVKKDYTG